MPKLDDVIEHDGQRWYLYTEHFVESDKAVTVTFQDTEGRPLPFLARSWGPVKGKIPPVYLPVMDALFKIGVEGPVFAANCDALPRLAMAAAREVPLTRYDP